MRETERDMPRIARTGEPEPQFNRLSEQEGAWSRRIIFILAIGLGPSVIVGALGYYEAAAWTFLVSLGVGGLIVLFIAKLDELDPFLEYFDTPKKKLILLALVLLYLAYKLTKTDWKNLFDFL